VTGTACIRAVARLFGVLLVAQATAADRFLAVAPGTSPGSRLVTVEAGSEPVFTVDGRPITAEVTEEARTLEFDYPAPAAVFEPLTGTAPEAAPGGQGGWR